MIAAEQAVELLTSLKITHIVWVPDSLFGPWESALERSSIRLLRVCREGEAWPLAAGLYIGGSRPLVIMQTTGLFESGDALRNVVFDLHVPVYAWIGVRNWMNPASPDSARRFARPILDAWNLDQVWIESAEDVPLLAVHYCRCQSAGSAGFALFAEGAG